MISRPQAPPTKFKTMNCTRLIGAESAEKPCPCQGPERLWGGVDRCTRESSVFGRSAGFQTGLERVGRLVDTLQPVDRLSRFGNRRSAKNSGIPVSVATRFSLRCIDPAGWG